MVGLFSVMAGHAKTPEERAAKRAKLEAEREGKRNAEREEKKRRHKLKSMLPADVAALDCAPPVESALPAVAASALPVAAPDCLPAAPAVQAVEVVEETRVEKGRKKIEAFYNECLDAPDLNVRDKLLAASQLGKILGLEKQEIKVEVSAAEQWVKAAREQSSSGSARMPWEH